jgi:DNA-directed RNA polymerase subunit M/transcription elongation factor TFIIS
MDINIITRSDTVKNLSKILDKKIAEEIEQGIYEFSKEYAEINDTPFLIESIYESKSEEILCQLTNQESNYLLNLIKENKLVDSKGGKIKLSKLAYLKPEELNPEKYENIIKKREMEEYKKNNTAGSNAFTCSKCKKSRCKISQKQTRAGDEPPTVFVTCLECGYTFKFN